MVARDNTEYVQYPLRGPYMNRSVPENKVLPGTFGELAGVDGTYKGALRKFYGMRKVVDLDETIGNIDIYDGPSYFKYVTFHKRETSNIYRGFVIRWDIANDNGNEQVDLLYTIDGSTWASHEIWAQAGNGITSSLNIDCVTDKGFLMVAVEGKPTKTVFYDGVSTLVTINSGPGDFDEALGAFTESSNATDANYNLRGNGVFQVAWRFYSSVRGIYSALSTPLTVTLDHLTAENTPEEHCKAVLDFPANTAVISGKGYNDFIGLFDTVEVFRTINMGKAYTDSGAIFYLEQTIDEDTSTTGSISAFADYSGTVAGTVKATTSAAHGLATNDYVTHTGTTNYNGTFQVTVIDADEYYFTDTWVSDDGTGTFTKTNWGDSISWDALQVTIGTLHDEALPFQTQYNPETDIVSAPPQSGAIGRYQGVTFMGQALATDGGIDTLHSSLEHVSPEYFTTFNDRKGTPAAGRPLRYINAGDSMFILYENGITHVFKSSTNKPLQFIDLHHGRGLVGQGAAHSAGNSIFMVCQLGFVILNGADGNMGQISSADRLFSDDWISTLNDIESGYDALMNTSYFLNPSTNEVLQINHATQAANMLEGANFVDLTHGPDVSDGKEVRAYFITATGLVVTPDYDESGSGTMWDLSSSYTLNSTITTGGNATNIIDSSATFHADMVGAMAYASSGDNAGLGREITAVDVGNKTLTVSSFPNNMTAGDRYAISPAPFKIRLWPLQNPDPREAILTFKRWNMEGIALKCRKLSGFGSNDNNVWRVGAYRNGSETLESGTGATVEIDVSENPSDSAAALSIDGIDIEPYIEQISSGTSFELTDVEVIVRITDSRKVTA